MYNIYIEDIVGNAFSIYLEKTGKRRLPLQKIEKYGDKVVESLNDKGFETRLVLGRDYTREFLFNYSDWFKLNGDEIVLSKKLSADDLINRFSGYLAIAVLKELREEENIKVLF